MSFVSECQVVTGATVVSIRPLPVPGDGVGGPFNARGRRWLYVRNHTDFQLTGPPIYIGGPRVTSATGYPLRGEEMILLAVTDRVQVHAVTSSPTAIVSVRTLEIV